MNNFKKALIVGAILLFGVATSSIDFPDNGNVVNVEVYRVHPGDTFWDVTSHFHSRDQRNLYFFEYMDEIRELNPQLQDNHFQLQPNDLITVHYVTRKE